MFRDRRRVARSLLALLACLAAAGPARLLAQASCPAPAAVLAAPRPWEPPLDRTVSLAAREVSLRDALSRLSAAARVRLSYSADLLPLDRRVCLSQRPLALGDALAELLGRAPVAPVVVGPDHVVLTPAPAAAARADSAAWTPATVLDRVVVTGSPAGSVERSLSVALTVLDGEELARAGTGTLAAALDGAVPGVWAWQATASSLLTRYASIRGASSFGASNPKVYIDGIEVANPLVVSRFTPETVERIEVIRGPQGAALYGTDAISGVVNIVTRHETVDSGAPRLRVRSGVGLARSDFATGAAVDQEHAVSYRAGSTARSLGFDLLLGTAGEFIPDAFSRRLAGNGRVRLVGGRSITTVTARVHAEDAGVAVSPVLREIGAGGSDSVPAFRGEGASDQSVLQYTLGSTTTLARDDRWTHSLVVGLDGDRLDSVPDDRLPVPFAPAADERVATGGADRLTLRASTVARFGTSDDGSGTLTLSAEHSVLRQIVDPALGRDSAASPGRTEIQSNSGLVAQGAVALRRAAHLTGGLRLERVNGAGAGSQLHLLPMLGFTSVLGNEGVAVKLRMAYGRGIRSVRTPARQSSWPGYHAQLRLLPLHPEAQEGVESGIDLLLGSALTLQLTRFDQHATGLVQRVALGRVRSQPAAPRYGGDRYRVVYALQNVGAIANRGWEAQASAALGALSLAGALSLVDSRVTRVAAGYTGDLRPGDRMLEVPARTAALTASWSGRDWTASLTARRAADWINYDRLALARVAVDSSPDAPALAGAELRSYWRRYDGVTHLRASLVHDLTRAVGLVLTADNLLDEQRGEPDNVTILPGRSFSLGVRAAF